MKRTFTGKVVWITGASSGIGEALVKAFAKEGARVILTARREAELKRVQHEAELNDSNSLILPVDLYHSEEIQPAIFKINDKFGAIDILVCNAGISQRALAKDTLPEVDRKIMELNYFSVITLTKAVLKGMLERQYGQIVVISSVMGKISIPLRSAYCASKHALHGFFEALRAEVFRDNIKVTLVCPGYIKTNVSVNALTGKGDKHGKMEDGQARGMAPEICARQIIRAVKLRREEVYIGGPEVAALQVNRFFPRVFSAVMKKMKFD